jgi:CheY-like chemotaxis protein
LARKILLADDSVTAQNMGRRILTDAGYDVTTVNNGSAALKKIAESKPDLIVLDVYMPGYGGLEVCQRLREAPETARIPVLLTVGKLEPFKADEARRVRADGFIVKPFEASELLTALTKLEDKIVPQGQPSKASRFAKALAGADDTLGREFGDSETGWKNRLSIPPPHSKPRESEPEEPPAVVAASRESSGTEAPKPAELKSGLEEAMLSSLPQDVTAEEIAAIKAAAAAVSAPVNDQLSNDQSTSAPIGQAEERSLESVVRDSISAVVQTDSSAPAAESAAPEPVSASEVPAATVAASAKIISETAASAAFQTAAAETKKVAEDEVNAALASLAPANGHGNAATTVREADKWELGARDLVPATMAVAGAAQEFSGPRWIAEPVPLREDEATLILEREMESAYAAFAAADAARTSYASSPAESHASSPVAEVSATIADANSSPVASFSNSDGSELKPQDPMPPAVAPTSEEPRTPEAEPSPLAASSIADAVSESATSEVKESAAYAAAASASPSAIESTIDAHAISQPSPVAEAAGNAPPVPESGERQGESELAAAWANWKQIRESVIGSQLSSQIAETVAELKETRNESAPTQPEAQPDASSATGDESSEISNIVDSVLADLKPKLMAEIAKKMGKEKNK